ncbi:858_t:CDS:2, partial [Gigaspora margarita]
QNGIERQQKQLLKKENLDIIKEKKKRKQSFSSYSKRIKERTKPTTTQG